MNKNFFLGFILGAISFTLICLFWITYFTYSSIEYQKTIDKNYPTINSINFSVNTKDARQFHLLITYQDSELDDMELGYEYPDAYITCENYRIIKEKSRIYFLNDVDFDLNNKSNQTIARNELKSFLDSKSLKILQIEILPVETTKQVVIEHIVKLK
jgi:hypothetical protein